MKTRRFLSLALSLALACSFSLPAAAAEETADQTLARVTAQVKQTLSIGDAYGTFYGSSYQNVLSTVWSLNWSGEDGSSLYVEAEDDGTVISCHYSQPSYARDGYDPAFPDLDGEAAQGLARDFLDRVLRPGLETARFDRADGYGSRSSRRFTGTILLNGIPSPLRFSLSLRTSDGAVTAFSRDSLGQRYLGGVPAAHASLSRDQALALLKPTLALRLEYVRPEGADTAVLRYLPETGDAYYVDGESGTLVNLSQRYRELEEDGGFYSASAGGNGSAAPTPAPEAAADGAALTAAEQAGIEKLEGVLSREALDAKVRACSALGLEGYALTNTSYAVNRETGEVTAALRYVRQAEEGAWRRTATVDAKTGALRSLSGSAPYDEGRAAALTPEQARAGAGAFLSSLWGDQFAKTALYDQEEAVSRGRYTFTFAQKANGYFFPENFLTVGVDVLDGSICALSRSFDDAVRFDGAEGLVGEAAALDAWLASFPTELAYVEVPQALDPDSGEAQPLLEMGLRYFCALKPGYALGDNACTGVDAKTGACVALPVREEAAFSYDDMEGHWAQAQVEALADCGAGFPGGSFQPGRALTQAEYLGLLLGAQGYVWSADDGYDGLYQQAYYLGFLTPDQRQDGKVLTRAEATALLLDALGYGRAARLEGIYTCTFADAEDIPEQYRGYAAIAQALGVVGGDNAGNFNANRTATRLEGALMLYNYMSR